MKTKTWFLLFSWAIIACKENNTKSYFLGIPIPIITYKTLDTLKFISPQDSLTTTHPHILTDSLFFVAQDTISYIIYYSPELSSDFQVKLSMPLHTVHFRVKPDLFYDLVNPAFQHRLVISKPEIFKYIPKYKQTIFWFDIGLKTKESSGLGMIVVDSLGKIWDTSFVSYDGVERFRYCFSPDTESVILGNHLLEFHDKRKFSLPGGSIFSAFLNNQVFCSVYDPMITDTIQQEQYIKANGDTVMKYYYDTRRDMKKNNVFIQNLAGDTLSQFRFDGICPNQMFQKQVLFTHIPEQHISVFIDPSNQQVRVINQQSSFHKIYHFKILNVPPNNFYTYFDVDLNCNTKNIQQKNSHSRFFLDVNNIVLGYIPQE